MNEIGTGMVQIVQLTGGYQEKNFRPKNEKRRRWIRRIILYALVLFFCILGFRRGINAYLAKQAEGKLQTATSYKNIYQSFERVERNQLQLRRKWENHRWINMSLHMEGVNLSSLMSSAGGAMYSVLGAVTDVTGVGGSGIGQYHQYMLEVSEESGSSALGTEGGMDENLSHQNMNTGDQQTGKDSFGIEGGDLSEEEGDNLHSVEGPDQWIVRGDYIYTIWMKDESEGWIEPEPRLVIYHAVDGQMEQVYEKDMGKTYKMEMMISGNYLYLVMNAGEYNPEHCMLYIYDITNPAKPQRKDVLVQYGSYYSMKIVGE
nr:beta-propeller domain-containing protein [Lachnospiraceae bacterium]